LYYSTDFVFVKRKFCVLQRFPVMFLFCFLKGFRIFVKFIFTNLQTCATIP